MSGFIDLDNWKCREHFFIYGGLANPFWSICADVDVTPLWQQSRDGKGRSFSFGAIYVALAAANETESFRLRIRGDKVWLHDRVGISTTILRSDETFAFARLCRLVSSRTRPTNLVTLDVQTYYAMEVPPR